MPHMVVAKALLNACLNGEAVADVLVLALPDVQRAGWRSAAAQALYAQALHRLALWCVDHDRYLHNVAVLQEGRYPVSMAVAPPPRTVSTAVRRALRQAVHQSVSREAEPADNLPAWSVAAPRLQPGEAVLIAAPLCLTQRANREVDAFLCDYPPLTRTPQDPAVRLLLPSHLGRALHADIGAEAAAWHPFSRILGIVRNHPRGREIEVLRVELCTPLALPRSYNLEPTWDEALVEETAALSPVDSESYWAAKEVQEYRDSRPAALLRARHAGGAQSDEEVLREATLERNKALAGTSTARNLTRANGSPYEGRDTFWCALAALLPAWQAQFALAPPKVSALLTAFDQVYDEEWKKLTSDPLLAGALRYTPEVMEAAREKIAGLSAAE